MHESNGPQLFAVNREAELVLVTMRMKNQKLKLGHLETA